MKKISCSILVMLLAGCGGGSGGSGDNGNSEETVSQDALKKNSETIVDENTGKTVEKITIVSGETTVVALKNNETFTLASGDLHSEELVIAGHLTIK
jgi:hypothetical protein